VLQRYLVDQKVLHFLNVERVCSLAVVMPDGGSHSAAMHYSYDPAHNTIIFLTSSASLKHTAVKDGRTTPASLAIGFSEMAMITLQFDGALAEIPASHLPSAKDVYFSKFPESRKYDSPDSAYLLFTIRSWKYTNHKTNEIFEN